MEAKIMTQHPEGLKGVNISRAKYDQMREAIIQALQAGGTLTFKQLNEAVVQRLADQFEGSISWYCTSVKLDLEAKQIIECTRKGGKAQEIRLV